MKKQNIAIGIFALVAVLGGVFAYLSSNKTETVAIPNPVVVQNAPTTTPAVETGIQKVDEHLTINNELRDVNFCGKMYKVKQVLIDGVDVVQRVAYLLTNHLIPETLEMGPYGPNRDQWKTILNKQDVIPKGLCEDIQMHTVNDILVINNIEKVSEYNYKFLLTDQSFIANIQSLKIYSISDSGLLVGPIGKLK